VRAFGSLMALEALALVALVAASVVPYFLNKSSERLFTPFPGFVALRFPVEGKPTQGKSRIVEASLDLAIVITVILMLIGYTLIVRTLVPKSPAGGAFVPLIPGVTVPVNLLVSLIWIIAIAVVVHELFHYLACVWQGIRVRSAGVGLLLFFPIAFVEPDEENLMRSPPRARARVYSAGPAANGVLAALALVLITVLIEKGVYVIDVEEGSPAWAAGIKKGDVIIEVNGQRVNNLIDLRKAISSGELLKVVVLRGEEKVTLLVNKDGRERIGVYVLPWVPKGPLRGLPPEEAAKAVQTLFWTHGVNLGLGVVNALPMFITDGGKLVSEVKRVRRLSSVADAFQLITVILFVHALVGSLRPLA